MTKVRVNVKERVEDNTIDLSLSELTDVPVRDIATFKRATILDLSSNNLVSLGKNFSQLTHLTKLDLSKNQIKTLPEDFGELKNLRHLNLYNNKIENLPLSFGSLTNLKYLDLKGNPLSPTIAKTAGLCSTNKECNESAKNTVKYFSLLQAEVEKATEKLRLLDSPAEVKKPEAQKSKKKKKKGKKSKMSNQTVEPKENDDLTSDENKQGDGEGNENGRDGELDLPPLKSMCVFKSILFFCLVLFVNILLVYVLTTKSSDIVEQIVANVPEAYRETIITFTDDMRFNYFRVSEWIRKWKTSPTPPLHNANF